MKKALIFTSLSMAAITMMTGCGGSDDSSCTGSVTSTFVDTNVVGLEYHCGASAEAKFTDDKGQFTCNKDDIVTFNIGDVVLGTLKATSDLATEVSPYNLSDDNDIVVNIAQLIQSCDDDGNISDVIKIDTNKSNQDFNTTIDSSSFDQDANSTLGGTLVSDDEAEAHLLKNAPDIVAPDIELLGDANVSLREGSTYSDAGVTVTDKHDDSTGFKTKLETTGLPVDTSKVGVNTITYTATDEAKNTSSKTRTVNVVTNAAPVVTLNGDANIEVRQNGVYTELNATATDDLDDNATITATIKITGSVDVAKPGEYVLTYTATDSEGKSGDAKRTVTVKEDKPPVVRLKGNKTVTLLDTKNSYKDAGATATDDFDKKVSDTLTPTDNVKPGVIGSYTYVWTATDDAGQDGSAIRTVNVVDGTPPVVTLKGKAAITCTPVGAYKDEGATATDNVDGKLTPVESGTVDLSKPGKYTVTWTATDKAKNEGTAKREVTVSACQNVNPITGGCEDIAECK